MKNQQSIEQNYNEFSMQCIRKHLFKDKVYILYAKENELLIGEELSIPKYTVILTLETKIYWQIEAEKLIAFGIESKEEIKYFFGKVDDLQKLWNHTRSKVIYKHFDDFYSPIQQLGKGGQSKIFLIINKFTQEEFASKNIEKSILKLNGQKQQQIFNEINLLVECKHESVIAVQEIFEGEETYFIVLDHLKGGSLYDILKTNKQINWEDIRVILWQLLNAVAYFHQKDIMHRDLKPENIMFKELNEINTLKIVDFGLAVKCQTIPYQFSKCGTPGYIAPEVANLKDFNQQYNKLCDIFSIGCILYKLITLQDLFNGNDYHQILKMNQECNINLECVKAPLVAIDLLEKMLNQNPSKRITATQALEHSFFISHLTERKIKQKNFNKFKFNQSLSKTTSSSESQKKKQTPLSEREIQQYFAEEFQIEDENVKPMTPLIISPKIITMQSPLLRNQTVKDFQTFKPISDYKQYLTFNYDPISTQLLSQESDMPTQKKIIDQQKQVSQLHIQQPIINEDDNESKL